MAKLFVKDVSTIMDSTIVTGLLQEGNLKIGMKCKTADMRTLEIATLEVNHEPKQRGSVEESVNVGVKLLSNSFGAGVASMKTPEYEVLKSAKGTVLEFS
jgi:hypothetical protein